MKTEKKNSFDPKMFPNLIREDYIKDYFTYLSTINWTEWWLVAIIIFHSSCFVLLLLTKKYQTFQFGLFVTLLAVIYFAENINSLGAQHWRLFSSEQYFDSTGLFISTVLSIPILFNCTVLIIMWLYTAVTMLVKVKRAELRERTNENTKKEENLLNVEKEKAD